MAMSEETSTAPEGFNEKVIAEFRANGGKVGGMFENMKLALLTTTGAKSGLKRTSPVAYLTVDGQPVVVASKGGAPTNPSWYHNLRANPNVVVEVGTEKYAATAQVLEGAARDEAFNKVAAQAPGFGEYQTKTDRVIPVIALHRDEA
jgi:deazaflavin-dependent oxidoreductase (nitroreductase family)